MEQETPPRQKRHGSVLVVDDSRFVRGYVVELLSAAGYEVDQAEDGSSALKRLDARSYDVVVTDLNMPTLDGFGPIGGKDHTVEEHMLTRSLFERVELLGRVLMTIDP